MKKVKKGSIIGIFTQVIFAFFAITSCFSCGNDFFIELGDDYAEEFENYEIVKITYRVPDRDPYHSDPYEVVIPGKIVNYNYDDNYIIVHQRYDKFYSEKSLETLISMHDTDSIIANLEMLKKINNCYWIIYKKKDIVAGPFNKHDFDAKCKKEGIKLEFKDEHRLFW